MNRFYSVQKTDFIDGEVLHFHCNSKDIAFYDKLADLRKAKISDKKAVESDSQIQLNALNGTAPLSVLRFEIRFNGVQAIRRNFPGVLEHKLNFQWFFDSKLSQRTLLAHWSKLTSSLDYLALDTMKPLELLQNYLIENKRAAPQSALAAVMGIYVANQAGEQALRQTLEARFGKHAWSRLKPSMIVPDAHRHELVTKAQEVLEQFRPISIEDINKTT